MAAAVLRLQRAAGNRAVTALIAREPNEIIYADDESEMMSVTDEAMDRSPRAARFIRRAMAKGYEFQFTRARRGTATDHAAKLVYVNPTGLTRAQKVMRVMYESANVMNEELFDEVKRKRAAGAYSSGEEYAHAVVDAESTTAVYASMMALEAGMTYSSTLDPIVSAATKVDAATGGRDWASAEAMNRTFARAANLVWTTARVTDEQGQVMPAREFYAKQWRPQAPAPAPVP